MRSTTKKTFFASCFCIGTVLCANAQPDWLNAGLLFDDFPLTLADGHRTEALGPLFNFEEKETQQRWAVPPLGSYTRDSDTDFSEFDLAYPILTYDRFGREYRWQFFQVFSFAGGQDPSENMARRFTLFPFYFQQRSTDAAENYTALIPFYGHLKNHLLRDEIKFVMIPVYAQSRKSDVVTDNWFYPIFSLRRGDGLRGWKFWPVVGHEHKEITTKTNIWGDEERIGGHDKFFAVWPFFHNASTGIGTTNPVHQNALLPVYSLYRSPLRDSSTYALFFNYSDDREKKYHELDVPWPLIEFARGEGKTGNRAWPLFSHMKTPTQQSDFYVWPFYSFKCFHSDPLERERTRILFFLYSDVNEKNTETGVASNRKDFWPLFTRKKNFNGDTRLQILAPLEPFLPNNKSIERDYSPVWSVFRAEQNAKTGANSQSLLWNLYRRDAAPASKKISLLFGLFQYQSNPQGKLWRIFYVPFGKSAKEMNSQPAPEEKSP